MNELARRGRGLDFGDLFNTFLEPVDNMFADSDFARHLTTSVDEDENNYYVRAEVPGLTKDDIDIDYQDNILTISAEWKKDDKNTIRRGKFEKSFTVRNINTDEMEASLNDGILKITMPKSQEARTRKVEIQTE